MTSFLNTTLSRHFQICRLSDLTKLLHVPLMMMRFAQALEVDRASADLRPLAYAPQI